MFKYNGLSHKLLKNQQIARKNKNSALSVELLLKKIYDMISAVLLFFAFDKITPFGKKKFEIKTKRDNSSSRIINNDYIIKFLIKFLKLSVASLAIILLWLGAEHIKNYMTTSKKFLISDIKINGCNIIPKKNIKNLYLEYCYSKGIPEYSNIFKFDINELHKYIIDRCNAIEKLYISRNFDYSVGINIIEKIPVGIVIGEDNNIKLIDAKLNLFDIKDPLKTDYLVLSVSGYKIDMSGKKIDNQDMSRLIKITNTIPSKIKDTVSEIEYNKGNFVLYLKNGIKVYCYSDNYIGRLENIDIILSSCESGYIDYIDLRFKNIYMMPKIKEKEKKI
ncbi:cell division protein FtsQ/DivIB [Candidatus Dependentiae bacterium]|nr:cell division protein FtsQ/DivIB [Candidatus Dependentiae bacterium]